MNPERTSAIIFLITYAGIAFGSIPRLSIDRTGIALPGAIAMLTAGILTEDEAIRAIDIPTVLLLYSLMVLSVQLTVGGFYTRVALSITENMKKPEIFLFEK